VKPIKSVIERLDIVAMCIYMRFYKLRYVYTGSYR